MLILGQDDLGRSCIVEERDIEMTPIPQVAGTSFMSLFTTTESPPPACPPGLGTKSPGTLAPGLLHWYIVDHEPMDVADLHGPGAELHYRDALEFVLIMSGGGDMLLDDGVHPVKDGDCIVMPGSSHGLLTGPEGCRLVAFAVGTPSPA